MNPADQPPIHEAPRSTDPPSLWLSLVLGSVLIHLVLFILASLFLTRTARVEIDPEPISVEFVDPTAVTAKSIASGQPIAARPGSPSSTKPSATQPQTDTARSQPSAVNPAATSSVNPAVEQPFVPQSTPRRRSPIRTRQTPPKPSRKPVLPFRKPVPPLPDPANSSTQPPPNSTRNPFPQSPFPQSPGSPDPKQTLPPSSSSQERLPANLPNPSGSSESPSAGLPSPAVGEPISQGPQGDSVVVTVLSARQPSVVDVQKQPAQPIDSSKAVLISYPSTLGNQTIHLEVLLNIDQKTGRMLRVEKATLLPPLPGIAIDEATLYELADQIFRQWQFSPAKDTSDDGKLLTPQESNLIIDAQVKLP